MEHPDPIIRDKQYEELQNLNDEDRAHQAQLYRVLNAIYCYYDKAANFNPSEHDFKEWLEGLEFPMREHFKNEGFKRCKKVVSFKRYVLEKHDIGMDAWIKAHISEHDFRLYLLINV